MAYRTDFGEAGLAITEKLGKAREAKGLSIEEAGRASGLKTEHIAKIEQGELTFLPVPYVLTMLREYASALGAYDEELFAKMKAEVMGAPEAPGPKPPESGDAGKLSQKGVVLAIAALLLALLLFKTLFSPGPDLEENTGKATGQSTPPSALAESAPVAPMQETAEPSISEPPGQPEAPPSTPTLEPVATEPRPQAETGFVQASEPKPEVSQTRAEGTFTTAIDRAKREPLDKLGSVAAGTTTLLYFSDVRNPSGETIYHEWLHNGAPVQRIPAGTPKGGRWRSWSSKSLGGITGGTWTVRVVDGERVIRTDTIGMEQDSRE